MCVCLVRSWQRLCVLCPSLFALSLSLSLSLLLCVCVSESVCVRERDGIMGYTLIEAALCANTLPSLPCFFQSAVRACVCVCVCVCLAVPDVVSLRHLCEMCI